MSGKEALAGSVPPNIRRPQFSSAIMSAIKDTAVTVRVANTGEPIDAMIITRQRLLGQGDIPRNEFLIRKEVERLKGLVAEGKIGAMSNEQIRDIAAIKVGVDVEERRAATIQGVLDRGIARIELTDHERKVLRSRLRGKTNDEIGNILGYTRNHISRIVTGIRERVEAEVFDPKGIKPFSFFPRGYNLHQAAKEEKLDNVEFLGERYTTIEEATRCAQQKKLLRSYVPEAPEGYTPLAQPDLPRNEYGRLQWAVRSGKIRSKKIGRFVFVATEDFQAMQKTSAS